MIPLEFLTLETQHGYDCENSECYNLLYNLKLKECERLPSIILKPHFICRNHKTIFKQSYSP